MHKCDAYILLCHRLLLLLLLLLFLSFSLSLSFLPPFRNHSYSYEFPYCHLSFAFSFAAYDEPYLLALLADCIEIRTVEPCLFIQSLSLPKPRLVYRCHQGLVYVASIDYVWCLQAVPLTQQIHILLEEKQFQLALRLTVCTMFRMKLCITFEIHCRSKG